MAWIGFMNEYGTCYPFQITQIERFIKFNIIENVWHLKLSRRKYEKFS